MGRYQVGFYGLPQVSLIGSTSDTEGLDLEDLGFMKFSEIKPDVPVPTPTKVCLDLSSRFDADVMLSEDRTGTALFGGSFQDPHPEPWWNAIHGRRSALAASLNRL